MWLSFSIALFLFAGLIGLLYLIKTYSKPALRAQISRDDSNNDSSQDGGGGDGGIDYDPDAPLDLPPGIYVLPKEPVGISE